MAKTIFTMVSAEAFNTRRSSSNRYMKFSVEELSDDITAQNDLIQSEQESTQVDQVIEAVEEGVEVAETLQDQVDQQEQLVEEAPEQVTEEVVQVAQESLAYQMGRLNMSFEDFRSQRVSVEAYNNSPVMKLKATTEGIKEFLVKIWEKIKAFFAAIWNGIKSLFGKKEKVIENNTKEIKSILGQKSERRLKDAAELTKIKADIGKALRPVKMFDNNTGLSSIGSSATSAIKVFNSMKSLNTTYKNVFNFNNLINGKAPDAAQMASDLAKVFNDLALKGKVSADGSVFGLNVKGDEVIVLVVKDVIHNKKESNSGAVEKQYEIKGYPLGDLGNVSDDKLGENAIKYVGTSIDKLWAPGETIGKAAEDLKDPMGVINEFEKTSKLIESQLKDALNKNASVNESDLTRQVTATTNSLTNTTTVIIKAAKELFDYVDKLQQSWKNVCILMTEVSGVKQGEVKEWGSPGRDSNS